MANQNRRKSKPTPKTGKRLPVVWLITAGIGLVLVATVLGLLANNTATLSSSPSGKPRISVDKQEIDLGEVKLGQQVTASFTITNTGDGALSFSEAPYIEIKEGC